MNNEENNQYLLFVFGEFKNQEKLIELMSLQLDAFVDEDTFLKFNYGDYGIIFNFESKFSFNNLREHVQIIFESVTSQYIFMVRPQYYHVFMPNELKLNLFDIHSPNQRNKNRESDESIIEKFLFNISTTFEPKDFIFEESNTELFRKIMGKLDDVEIEEPTIDDLLEKIQEKGIKSLTKYEIQILDEYSKSQK